jgi:small GTP-binding protein
MRFCEGKFSTTFVSTVGIDFKYKLLRIADKRVRLELWDTAGQERFKSITTSYLRGAQGIIICYDISDRKTFSRVDAWLEDIQAYSDLAVDRVLVGCKCDLDSSRAVLTEEGAALAAAHSMPFFEVSSKNDIRIHAPFETLAKSVLNRMERKALAAGTTKGIDVTSATISNSNNNSGGGGCCYG